MGTFVIILSVLLLLIGAGGFCWLLFEAYGDDQTQGWLCLILFPYALYYAFFRLDADHKWWIRGLWLGGKITGGILFEVAKQF